MTFAIDWNIVHHRKKRSSIPYNQLIFILSRIFNSILNIKNAIALKNGFTKLLSIYLQCEIPLHRNYRYNITSNSNAVVNNWKLLEFRIITFHVFNVHANGVISTVISIKMKSTMSIFVFLSAKRTSNGISYSKLNEKFCAQSTKL